MSRQYRRWLSLVIADESGRGLELNTLQSVFNIQKLGGSTPNRCDVTINNVAPSTASRIGKEFTRIQIMAGYEGQFGKIFDGTILQNRMSGDAGSSADTYLALTAVDGDQADNVAGANRTLAGAKPADIHATACMAMNPQGVTQDYTMPKTGPALPQGKVLFDMARNVLNDNRPSTDVQWMIVDGEVQIIPQNGYCNTQAVVLTSDTGLIGPPQVTESGIMVRCRLNPRLEVNGRIYLDNSRIQQLWIGDDPRNQAQKDQIPSKSSDGIYRILAVNHHGDTRGQTWYSDLICISAHAAP